MKGDTFVKFRNWDEAYVKYDIDFSGPGSGCSVEWWFGYMTAAQHAALDITAEEDEAIAQECIAVAEGRSGDYRDDDVMISGALGPGEQLGTPISELSTTPGTPGYAAFVRIGKSWGYD